MKIRDYIKPIVTTTIVAGALLFVTTANAVPLSVFNGWTEIASEDQTSTGYVNPGYGGQPFDAEYLVYKLEGNNLNIGLQTGFNVADGVQQHNGKNYYSGDLFLSFNETPLTFEYAVDFGLYTEDYKNDQVGTAGLHAAGLYKVLTVNNDMVPSFSSTSAPFAMESGDMVAGALKGNTDGGPLLNGTLGSSYYRIITLDMTTLITENIITGYDPFTLGAHWTMSCGNDNIEGSADVAPVPEPATMLLFGTGLAGLAGLRSRKKK